MTKKKKPATTKKKPTTKKERHDPMQLPPAASQRPYSEWRFQTPTTKLTA
jgi:hypothetical protein